MQKKRNNETINRDDIVKYVLKNKKSIDELQQMLTENELEKINCRRI